MSRSYRHSPGISEGSEKWDKRQMNKAIRADMRSQIGRVANDTLDGYNVTLLRNKLARSLWDMRKDGHNVAFGSFRVIVKVKREQISLFHWTGSYTTGDCTFCERIDHDCSYKMTRRRTYAVQLPFCSYWCKEDDHKPWRSWNKTKATDKWCETNMGFGK